MIRFKYFFGNVYIAALLEIAAILLILKDLQFIFGGSPPLLLFLVPIAFAVWYGGLKTGFFITVISAVASDYFLVEPYYSFYVAQPSEILRIALLVGIGAVCSLIIARLHNQEKQALHTVMEREKQLKHEITERNLYILLAKSSTEFIGMFDTDRVPFFINDAGLRLIGLDSIEQGIKTPVKEFFFPEDQTFITNEFFPAVLQNGTGEIEIRFRHFKTGEALWMIYNVFTLKDLNGNKVGFGTVSTNITERKRIAEGLRVANQSKDEFLAMLAHELRNPLAPIRNAVQLLKIQAPTDPKLAWSCNVIDRQVSHMVRLLDDLLDVARIMQGKIRLSIEHLELTEIVNNAVETSRPLIESRGQELTISLATMPQWIEGDRVRLAQVLSNLLNNAAKYTGEGGKITLSVMHSGSDVVIKVLDTGIGISPEILPHIFDLFTQADHSLAHSQGGLGIGLTLVRQLVEMHGGKVTVASAGIGQGSSFMVRLPVLAMAIDSSATQSVLTESTLAMPKFRILIVDDYADAAESLMMVLEAEGHEVEIADCGMKAIEQAQVFQPQVVLLDIGLPDLNGFEVAKRLRALPKTREANLIALTGYGNPENVGLAQSAGFNHQLLKPVDFEKLSILLASSPDERSGKTSLAS